ncbi:hypothetical protein BXZ70DRAFT_782309 [Cristinia sonorae]|uniref:Xylanolytic transcriptional activator regulatory domain-containing protein n=1 Tax=Cristinia sonorae TaxID=1940300 RepID=A0A8K0XRH4_9AGAR|nr:hypothetical protein BXZ70DRAFT_782309 [Cristinia sonorae]
MHAPPDAGVPDGPVCTFDDVAEPIPNTDDEPERRYATLENRILELENMLRTQSREGEVDVSRTSTFVQGSSTPTRTTNHNLDFMGTPDSGENGPNDYLTASSDFMWKSPSGGINDAPFTSSYHHSPSPSLDNSPAMQTSWPQHLPPLGMVKHLTEVFFAYNLFAHRLLHAPSFFTSLTYPPNHPQFPAPALLHAICAVGNSCNAAASNWESRQAVGSSQNNFCGQQALYAKRLVDDNIGTGRDLMQQLQANILLTWFYWWQASWVEVYTRVAITLRTAVALGFNLAPQFTSVSPSTRPTSLIPAPTTALEEEMRRNTFWIAYALERLYGTSNGWAMSLDDQDIFQLLPMSEQLQTGAVRDANDRQLSQSRDLLLLHPSSHTDSFVLFIKSAILLSRVKVFNSRMRARFFAQDPSLPQSHPISDIRFDPRETSEFGALSSDASAFLDSLPSHLKSPVVNGTVDPFMFNVLLAPSIALILLHEPYAMVGKDSCISAYHILTCARGIASLTHMIVSTNHDCTRLGWFPVFAWFTSARVLSRFLKAAQEEKYAEQIAVLTNEISFIFSIIKDMGERVPLSRRYAKMLEEHVTKTCGFESAMKICPLDTPQLGQERIGFAPELQEGDTADALLSLRLANLSAMKGNTRPSSANLVSSFWPSAMPGTEHIL